MLSACEKRGGDLANKIMVTEIPATYDPLETEPKWQQRWREFDVYRFRAEDMKTPTYVIDTPPPYSSQEGGTEWGVPHGHGTQLDLL